MALTLSRLVAETMIDDHHLESLATVVVTITMTTLMMTATRLAADIEVWTIRIVHRAIALEMVAIVERTLIITTVTLPAETIAAGVVVTTIILMTIAVAVSHQRSLRLAISMLVLSWKKGRSTILLWRRS